jgi:germination protein M
VRRLVVALVALLLVPLGGCAGDEETVTTVEPPPTTNVVRVYFLRDGKLVPAAREVPAGVAQANAALDELLRGPTAEESGELGLETSLPADLASYSLLAAGGGMRGAVSLDFGRRLPRAARAQVVATLTQFPLVEAVALGDRTYDRASFEDLTPAILVESPLALDEVSSPLHAFGTSNTFEANFSYELLDAEGGVLDEDFVTATSGTGTRGRFEFTAPYEVDEPSDGTLVVFELSAKDGSRINVVEIPLRLGS